MDAFAWAHEATVKLQEEFGNRLVFVGLQGSRARGEAHKGSDIDLVVLLDHVRSADLARYRTLIQSMPHAKLACGFVGAADVLAAWPRHELFQFAHDTHAIYGDLAPIVGNFTRDDVIQAARIGASGIYHAACHASVFDGDAIDEILQSLFKGAFFTLQALHFARTSIYPRTKAELAQHLEDNGPENEARILEIGRSWKANCPATDTERQAMVDLLLEWSGEILKTDEEPEEV